MGYDIIITNADRGGALVILDVKDYVEEWERQLNNTDDYTHSQKDSAATNNELVLKVKKRFENEKLIQKNIAKGIKINSPRTPPRLHPQPKIHKERNLGRLVIIYLNCHISKISEYVDCHLQPIVKQIPSYVKDTSDLISKLKTVETGIY